LDEQAQRVEKLSDEILEKENFIDKQAVLNKNIQKKADGLADELR
jgi:hypothetical protein